MKTKLSHTSLLAKSTPLGRDPITVGMHITDVMNAVVGLFGTPETPTALAVEWCCFLGIPDQQIGNFIAHVRLAAFCHDWGKANDGYQRMLVRQGEQLLRHEQVSAVIMCWPSVWAWLHTSGLDIPIILSAVIGHHLKCRDLDLGRPSAEADQLLRLRWDDDEFRAYLTVTAGVLSMSGPGAIRRTEDLRLCG